MGYRGLLSKFEKLSDECAIRHSFKWEIYSLVRRKWYRKSSISDAIEWFYNNRVEHLSNSEIDLKDALRNTELQEDEASDVQIAFKNESSLDSVKSIIVKRDKLTVDSSNNTEDFNKYINESKNENLLLRYQYLTGFIDNTKTDKLKYLSDIIGFSEVTKTKDVLGKSYRAITREIKSQNFEGQINTQKKTLLENLEATISQENQLFDKINEKTKPCR